MGATPRDRQRVVVVTGGGGGIGAAIAENLGRDGAFVVTMDPLVSVDGSEQLPAAEDTTAGRIVAAGGSARSSSVSVTDGAGVRELFEALVEEFGGLDAVVNVAGITRTTSFATGKEEDWHEVLAVHLDGYLNILGAALPIMSAAGYGRILGVTSGSGWRPANAGAYGCAKRAVASLTWQLGRHLPPGVVVNAMSPIAATRMVTAALGRARRGGSGSAAPSTGGLSLASMPTPEQIGPLGAHLVDDDFSWCSGQVVFAGGSELAVIQEPRLLEVVRADEVTSSAHFLEAVTAGALAPAEANQASNGGSNPRFGPIFDDPTGAGDLPPSVVHACAVVTDRPEVGAAVAAALDARAVNCTTVAADGLAGGFEAAADALASIAESIGPLDAVVVALAGGPPAAGSMGDWERTLAEHAGIVGQIQADAGWTRAVADHAARAGRPIRLVTLTDATTAGGKSRAQASTQLARGARSATADSVTAFSVGIETPWTGSAHPISELVAHLLCNPETQVLSGAELVAGAGWFGLRSHPRPSASITFGGPEIPNWLDGTLRSIVGVNGRHP